ncbi:MAG: type II secretion system F family protein [Patescibacteria group bacterium]
MPIFSYTGLDKNNNYVKATLETGNLKKAAQLLEKEGVILVNIQEERTLKKTLTERLFNNVTRLDKIFFTRHLSTMLESGIALDQAIKIIAEQTTNKTFKTTLYDIYKRLQGGESLFECLAAHPKYFSKFYINIIRVGEKSGKLDEVLAQLLEQQESDYELINRARGAMVYPAVIISALIVMVVFMMTFVIPKVTSVLSEYHVKLPLATRILIGLSNFILHYGYYVFPALIVLVYLFLRWIKSKKGKKRWDAFLLKIPHLKKIMAEFNLARFARSMSALMKSGVPIDESLALAADVSSNTFYAESLASGIQFVRKGIPLAEILKGHPKLYPPITVRMIEVGEKTGKLDHMLSRLATFYEKSVLNTIANLASVIEPVLLLCIGLAVAFVAISVLTPIWKFSETV